MLSLQIENINIKIDLLHICIYKTIYSANHVHTCI